MPPPKPKRKKRKRKTKPKPKIGEFMDPTEDFGKRERYIARRTNWMWRLAPYIKKMNETQCASCQMGHRCNRIPCNERITGMILAGKECPDHRSMWKKILGNDEEYDWGF